MTEVRKILNSLGWSEELIDAFLSKPLEPSYEDTSDLMISMLPSDSAEIKLRMEKSMIRDGTDLRLVAG